MVKLEKHIKKLTAAALAGMMALALFAPGALAESDAEPQDPEAALLSDEESATEASYSVKLAAWADADFDPDAEDGSLYHTGKNFCVDVVVSGDPFSAFQGNVVYDSDRLIYDADETKADLEKNSSSGRVTVEAIDDGKISIIRNGNVTSSPNTVVARLYFTAKKDKRSTIDMSDVKVGLGTGNGGSVVLTEESITPCVVDVTKSYMMTDIALSKGDVKVDASGSVNVDIDGGFAVDVISMGRDIECAELTVSYDTEKLKFDSEKTEASKAEGCTVSETASGKIMIMRNSSGIKAGNAIATLYFKATAQGTASIDIASAKAGTSVAPTVYGAEDLAGCSIKVNAPEPEGVAVNVKSYLGDGAVLDGVVDGENTLKGEFTFTVKASSKPVAVSTTDNGATYVKLASTSADGVYSFTATAEEGMKIVVALLGDVDYNGVIDADDVTKLARHIAMIELIADNFSLVTADVDNDNELTADDVTKVARHIAKIESI